MMKTTTIMAAAAAFLGFFAAIPDAAAEEKGSQKDDNYGYIFTDDVLNAGNPSAVGGLINVVKLARRDRLLRPRLHFVPEMLKSVETM
jgi:hypothetical protein